MRQRARWLKGFLMTWLVHMREPSLFMREVGPAGFWVAQVLTLGVFALPELCDLLVARTAVVEQGKMQNNWKGLWQGSADCFTHWWLNIRCAWIGSVIGAIPGISASVIDWISYAHALKTEKDARLTFGRGDVRGVIAAESATCSREGGALIPTIVFGVPGSAGMAILLGAFLMHGLVPGPEMLTKHLAVTYSMVWSIAIANILGSGLCYIFSSQFAKLAGLRYTLILPSTLAIIYIGAFQGSRNWGDLYTLLAFGLLGWAMKMLKWPRPPLLLGCVLGDIVERYLFISIHADPRSEYPFYLGHADETGEDAGTGYNMNIPLPHGATAPQWFAALETACYKLAAFAPDALVVSLGVDTFAGDPLSHFALQSADFLRVGERIAHLGLPTAFVFEGGYAVAEIGINVVNVLEGFETAV